MGILCLVGLVLSCSGACMWRSDTRARPKTIGMQLLPVYHMLLCCWAGTSRKDMHMPLMLLCLDADQLC